MSMDDTAGSPPDGSDHAREHPGTSSNPESIRAEAPREDLALWVKRVKVVLIALAAGGFMGTTGVTGYEVAQIANETSILQQEQRQISELQAQVQQLRATVADGPRQVLMPAQHGGEGSDLVEPMARICICVAIHPVAGRPRHVYCPTAGETCDEEEARRCSETLKPNYAC